MKNFSKSFSRAIALFLAGVIAWLALVSLADQSIVHLPPVGWVMVMSLSIMAFAAAAFWMHRRSIAGLPIEDHRARRRPSYIIPVISTIVFMMFVVAQTGGNPAIWAMG
ncbi:MAG TPA: hypothetical protein VFG67_05015 [Oleiagrimonas sp.]|nr:hypothetical protein [Oleiagrimonas sp.]